MRWCSASLILLTLPACLHRIETPVPVSDYCVKARLMDVGALARPGESVTVGADGYGDRAVLTRPLGNQIVAHNRQVRECKERETE